MQRIRNVSLFFRYIFQLIMIILPVLVVLSWLYAPHELILLMGFIKINAIPTHYLGTHLFSPQGMPENIIMHTLTMNEKILACLVDFLPTIVQLFVLYFLIKLFKLYEQGQIFSLQHVKYIRNIGYALLAGQIIEPIYQALMGIVLTLNNPPHHHFFSITLGQNNIGLLLTALLVILISWIMAEAYQLQEEQKLTI